MSKFDQYYDAIYQALNGIREEAVAQEVFIVKDKIALLCEYPDRFTSKDFLSAQAAIVRLAYLDADHDDLEDKLYRLYSHLLKSRHSKLGTSNRSGFVYLILDHESMRCKIGRAKNWKRRVKQFGVELPFPHSVLHVIRCKDMVEAETMLHKHYSQFRTNGEWFSLDDNHIEEIKMIQEL